MSRGLSEEFGLVKEAEQQLLLYNIFISHQLASLQVHCMQLLKCDILQWKWKWAPFLKTRDDTGSGMAIWPRRQKPFSIRWEDLLLGLVFGIWAIWAIDNIKYKITNSPSGEKIYCWVTFFVGNLCGIFLGQLGEEMYCWVTNFTIYDVAVFKGFNTFHVSL